MPQVIKAVQTYGREGAYHLIGASRELEQTGASIDWVIDELNDARSNDHENYVYNLSMVLVEAEPTLLLPRESAILEARHFLEFLHPAFTERLRILRGTSRLAGGTWKSSARRRKTSNIQ